MSPPFMYVMPVVPRMDGADRFFLIVTLVIFLLIAVGFAVSLLGV